MSPHDFGACQELENEMLRLRKQSAADQLVLLVTGDLTVSGDASQFAMAQSYLRGRMRTSWAGGIGLGNIFDAVITIPGNHDHLGGRLARTLIRQRPAAPAYVFFPPSQSKNNAWWQLHEIQTNDLLIQIGTLDSCGANTAQFGARGAIDPHAINELEHAMLMGSRPSLHTSRVRILMVHHSLTPSGNGALALAHALDAQSQRLVQAYCQRTGTQFILTGHEHRPLMPTGSAVSYGNEIRCGSSLQEGSHSGYGQVFLVHSVNGGQNAYWRTVAYQRIGQRSFVPATRISYSSAL